MSLLEKKHCAVCGKRIALTDGIELRDGSICGTCAAGFSPWLSNAQQLTVDQARQHLAYREDNLAQAAAFNATRAFGNSTKLLLDDTRRQFVMAFGANWKDGNPDVMGFSQMQSCVVEVRENRTELMHLDENGLSRPYEPPRYESDFDFQLTVLVDSPWFSAMSLRVNDSPIKGRSSVEYNDCLRQANEMRKALELAAEGARH